MAALVHSVPLVAQAEPCAVTARAPHPALRRFVVGYSGFRSGSGLPIAHRVLPLTLPTVIVDFGSRSGLVSGARGTATTEGETTWGHGVSLALTPAGAAALLGMPMSELTGRSVALADLLGTALTELPGRLAAAPTWAERFVLLESVLAARLGLPPPVSGPARVPPGPAGERHPASGTRPVEPFAAAGPARAPGDRSRGPDATPAPVVLEAWRRLQLPGCRRVGPLAAELGIGRRRLEQAFRRHIGLSPATVARIARFQRAVDQLGRGAGPAAAAAACGYADQPHLNRETRALAGCTPAELAGSLRPAGAQSSKTRRCGAG